MKKTKELAKFSEDHVRQKRDEYVFEFFDGKKNRKVDVWKAVVKLERKMPLEVLEVGNIGGDEIVKLIDAFSEALGIPRWSEDDEDGLTDGDIIEVIQLFMSFINTEKKTPKPRQTLPLSMGQAS